MAGPFIGPLLAGVLTGVTVPFGGHAGLLAAVAAMAVPRRAPVVSPATLMASLREGLLWLWRDAALLRLSLLLGGFDVIG